MAALSRLLTAAGSALLLLEVPVLLRSADRLGRRCLKAQLQLLFVFWLVRRAVSSPPLWKRIEGNPALQALERWRQTSGGSLAAGAVVPALLAISGLPLAFNSGSLQQKRWLLRVLIYGSVPTLADAVDEHFGEEVDTIAVLAFELGLLMKEHAAAAVILLMLSGGEALEHYVFTRARHGLQHVLDRDPPVAHRLVRPHQADSVELEDVDADVICCGDVLVVRAGEVVPVDGKLLRSGKDEVAVVDEGLLTGEAGGTVKRADDLILSGSVSHTTLRLLVTTPFAGSTLELMRQALQDALDRKGGLQQRSAKAASLLKPLTLVVAAIALLLRRRRPVLRRWSVVLSVLMSATPCPASIGVPVSFLSGMNVAARHGVLIKSGEAIESLAAASHVVLDKTGTLTRGEPAVRSFEVQGCAVGDPAWQEALKLVASVELLSTHPLAEAICRFAAREGVALLKAEEPEHAYGCGIIGTVQGRRVAIGTTAFLEGHGLRTAAGVRSGGDAALLEVHFAAAASSQHSALAGHVLLEDPLREGTAAAVTKLRQLGLHVSILSGDRSAHLDAVAHKVGIHDARGGCLPQEKARLVKELASNGQVIMVGDESNDAPALAAANVGISVGRSGLASQSADVVVAEHPSAGALERIARLVALSRKVVATAGRGVRCGLGLSALQVAAAGSGRIPPKANAIMQELVDLSALVNAASVLSHRW